MSATILVVDDNPTNLKLVSDVLEFEGYDILKAVDAEEAQLVLAATLPDLILMDIALPGMDGLTLTRKLKAEERTRGLRIVALTAFAMKGDDQKALDAGCDGYITKPIDTRKLPGQVAGFLVRASGQSRSRRLKILVIEDHAVDLKLADLVLSTAGHDVRVAGAAEQAFAAIQEDRPQLILLDLNLPGKDSLALVRKLKADPDTRAIHVVAVTGYPEQYPKVAALAAGCDAYLLKPINTRELSGQLTAIAEGCDAVNWQAKEKAPMNILIIDDNLADLKLLRAQLESEGHTVFESHDGVDALALLECQRVDVVISDILMPRMDGYRLCHEIRKHARLRDLPIIIYSSTYTAPQDEKLALDMGADKYLKKPASVATIVAALHEVVAQPHAAPRPGALREVEVLKNYNERLVSKLKEKNMELQAAEVKFRTLVEQSIVGIYIIQDDQLVYVNPRMVEILGRSEEEMTSRSLYDFAVPEDHALVRENIRQRMSGEMPSIHCYLRMLHQSGAVLEVEVHSSRTDYNGRPAVMGTLLDITERKQLAEQIRWATVLEERSRMARDVHDTLAQGFTGIVLNLEAAEEGAENLSEEVRHRIRRARDVARESLVEVRRSILALSSALPVHGDLPNSIREFVARYSPIIKTRVFFSVQGTPRHLDPAIEENLLRIAQQATDNALQHARARSIRIELAYNGTTVQLTIVDDGQGFKVKETGRRLGLLGMRERTEEIGGKFELKSQPGKGTRVAVKIPRPPTASQ